MRSFTGQVDVTYAGDDLPPTMEPIVRPCPLSAVACLAERMKQLEEENNELKRIIVESTDMAAGIRQKLDALEKSAGSAIRRCEQTNEENQHLRSAVVALENMIDAQKGQIKSLSDRLIFLADPTRS